ncbi:MAG: hypothetical protein D6731_06705 [Planctomycetota bacterium]|nr:MAG: hypothetical protein D6731_06705 [Planctomycetota bacterium]
MRPWALRAALVFAFAFVLRIAPLALPFDFRGPDTPSYLEPAESLAAGQGFRARDGRPSAVRPPGYPAFAAAVYLVCGGPSDLGLRIAQALLGALAAVAVAATLRGCGPRWSLAGGLLSALDPVAIGQAPFLLREALLLFLVAALLWARVRLGARARFLATCSLGAALVLTHQLYLLLAPSLCAAELWNLRRAHRRRLAGEALRWGAVLLVCASALFLWARRNERVLGRFSLTASSNAAPARELWLTSEYSNAWLSGDRATGFQHLAFAEERRLVEAVGVEEAKRVLLARAWANWRDHPLRSLGRLLRINLWYWLEVPGAVRLAEHPRLAVVRWGLLAFHWPRLVAAFAGVLWLAGGRGPRALRATALGTLAFFALAPSLLYPVPRYLGPACPLLDVLALLGLRTSVLRRSAAA